ncbi:metal-sensitive transcriptional regulator [Melghirimyces algeriensis]|uniref:DNA-binding transcriptional regulator, FrmR family n=1 Tax=Melghirimyces algeriensis TaxID=910412 RepID=A0A521EHH4_9BACL|nr:metal-sensitive transcriptional regulator [Melghirimyces algeriensis]SMO83368.1 DNA-binding transcriptional regulator, FrmR family [Melghirimyces algeriensis]
MDYNKKIQNRLRRIEGQIGGVLRMMDDGKECNDVLSQLSAIRKAVDRTIAVLVTSNLKQCLIEELQKENEGNTDDMLEEAVRLLVKSR